MKGNVRNVYDKTVFGVGYLGEGKYKTMINKQSTPQYIAWRDMLGRCYDLKLHEKNSTYIGYTVSEEWHNFQNFAKWYDENYYNVEGFIINLDKDILIKGNKIYSPDTCIFVPEKINILFTKRNKCRGKYPIGVDFRKSHNKYRSRYSDGIGKEVHIGYFNTPEESFFPDKLYNVY